MAIDLAPQRSDLRKPPSRFRLSLKGKCFLAALVLMLAPVLGWPLLALFVVGGCEGGMHNGIGCPPILGVSFHTLPTDLLVFGVKGFSLSIPLGLALLGVCLYFANRRKA